MLVVVLLAVAPVLAAQTTVTAGDIVNIGNSFPFNFSLMSGRYQHAYGASELQLPSGATVLEVHVHGSTVAPPTFNDFRLRLANTTTPHNALQATFNLNYTGNLHLGIGDPGTTAPVSYIPTTSPSATAGRTWYHFQLTTPFLYNGTDTLLLDWSYVTRTGTGWAVATASNRSRVYANGGNATIATGLTDLNGNLGIRLLVQVGPNLQVLAVPSGPHMVLADAQNLNAASFTVAANSMGPMTMTGIELAASGSGNDATAYSSITIYRDANSSNAFEAGLDQAITAPATFTVNDGNAFLPVLPAFGDFAASESRLYFIVVSLAGTALPGETFNIAVSDLTVSANTSSGVPTAAMPAIVIESAQFTLTDASPATAIAGQLGTDHNVCQSFVLSYPAGPADKPSTVTVTGLGSADESSDVVDAQLWLDADLSGSFTAAGDTLLSTQSFQLDNGSVTFSLATLANIPGGQSRQFFVVYRLGLTASHGETFSCYVSAVGLGALGGQTFGLPSPSLAGTAGIVVNAAVLIASLNGPQAPLTVNSNAQGSHGDGVLLCDVTLHAAPGGSWSVTSLEFEASGTMVPSSAFMQVALFEDDGSSTWDGGAIDAPATQPLPGFTGNSALLAVGPIALPAGTSRRYFLAGKLNGTAITGQTLNVRLKNVVGTPPPNGSIAGLPSAFSTALIVDVPTLTVLNGPNQPAGVTHKAGSPGVYVAAQFRLMALNSSATVSAMTFTGGGTGNWLSDVAPSTGFRLYLDDGDGVFDAASDQQLYVGGGATQINAALSSPLTIAAAAHADLWVRVFLTPTAGAGIVATPETFIVSIANAGSITASSQVVIGTPVPVGVALGAIQFGVLEFDPATDQQAGGKPVTLSGGGFMHPFQAKIGGVICPGTPVIIGGTQVTGLFVPAGSGTNLPIEITSGTLAPMVLAETFSYTSPGKPSGDSGPEAEGCSAQGGRLPALLLALPVLVMLRRRLNPARK